MAERKRAISRATLAVLAAMADGASYGFDIMDATTLPSGTVYPILARLEGRNLAESDWEDPRLHRAEGRPARKYYWLTAKGRSVLASERERLRALGLSLPRLA